MKKELRKISLEKRKIISSKDKDIKIIKNLFSMEVLCKLKNILIYYPLKYEPDTRICFSYREKNWFLPRVNGLNLDICEYRYDQLERGKYNIIEPTNNKIDNYNKIDIIVVPAIAVDKKGYRIGYGKGYYDRLIPKLKKDCIKVYITYEDLIYQTIYPNEKDIKCDFIVSEKRVYKI